jgi:hypothetical protein
VEVNNQNLASDWRGQDPNCDLPDIVIGTQTWAWCNSTLGDWVEWWKQDDWSDGGFAYFWSQQACYNYEEVYDNSYCTIWSAHMDSASKEIDYFNMRQASWQTANWDIWVNNIWWKFYTHDNLDTNSDNNIDELDTNLVCGEWYHVPSQDECNQLLSNLWWADLWWLWHTSRNETNNLVQALNIPLSWYRATNWITFYYRWSRAHLWCWASWSYNLRVMSSSASVLPFGSVGTFWYSVRCIKD